MSGHHDDEARQREARAILERVRLETEPQVGAHSEAMFLRTRDHFMARDADPHDRVEVLATRLGRLLGLVGFAVLAVLLFLQFSGL